VFCPHLPHLPNIHFALSTDEPAGTSTISTDADVSDVTSDVEGVTPVSTAEEEKAQEAARIQSLVESGSNVLGSGTR
jgi:hypothetical protein